MLHCETVAPSVRDGRGNTNRIPSTFFDGSSMLEEGIRHASEEDLRRKLSAMNYSYMYELSADDAEGANTYTESTISCFRHLRNHLKHSYSLFKSWGLSYRPVVTPVISNPYVLRALLLVLICSKIVKKINNSGFFQ